MYTCPRLSVTCEWVVDDLNVDTGKVFLDDRPFTDESPRVVNLGAFPHECLGNVSLCPEGFTLAAWYKPILGDRQVRPLKPLLVVLARICIPARLRETGPIYVL